MTPEISEFSYGFALTNEIVGRVPLAAAPVFPSLIEEGRVSGGYDVRLDWPAVPLYLQFKRADCMRRRSAVEICDHNLPLEQPFYRFKQAFADPRWRSRSQILAAETGARTAGRVRCLSAPLSSLI